MYYTKWYSDDLYNHLKNDVLRLTDFHTLRKGKYYKGYYKVHCAFDIETTNISNEKLAFMYIWQFQINELTILGNTWSDFVSLLTMLEKILKLTSTHRLIVWVHNLSFETQFIHKWLNITEVFAREKRKPMYITHNNCIEFHDSMMITGSSLEHLAEHYTFTQKMKGDLDYNILRNSSDAKKLSNKELAYCENDVRILKEFSEFIWNTYIIPMNFLPLTKTGIVRKKVKDRCTKENKRGVQYCYPQEDLYKLMMNYGFRGGFTHANCEHVGSIIYDVDSFDITSSYPASMYHNLYAMDRYKKVKLDYLNKENFYECINKMSCVMTITFFNVKNKSTHSIESTNKCIQLKNPIVDNGRIVSCDEMSVTINQIDFKIYQMFYTWDNMKIHEMWIARQGKLPKYLLDVLYECYNKKNELKKQGKSDTIDYMLEKADVNSMYGCCVTKHTEYDITLGDVWESKPTEKSYNEIIKSEILLPQWGCEITSYSRYKLLKMIYDMDCLNKEKFNCNVSDVIYCDTDSIKFRNGYKYYDLFENVNNEIIKKNVELFGDNDNMMDLGTFDNESKVKGKPCYYQFKTLGAKRYIYVQRKKDKNVFGSTIAGLGKKMLVEHYRKERYNYKKNDLSIFDIFEDGLIIHDTGKLASRYNDDYTEYVVNGELMNERSSIALFPVEFSLTLNSAWLTYLNSLPLNIRKK